MLCGFVNACNLVTHQGDLGALFSVLCQLILPQRAASALHYELMKARRLCHGELNAQGVQQTLRPTSTTIEEII